MPKHGDHVIVISDDDDAVDNIAPTSTGSTLGAYETSFDILSSGTELPEEDLIDPCPDVHTLFQEYNRKHFQNRITHTYVEYSRRMTSCAGTCTFTRTGCRIALSEPLLKLRPVSDLKSTLLHEMIHAFLFLTQGYKRDGPDGHGPIFMRHAHRINRTERGIQITPYHTFHAEVDVYRVHHWQCDKCGRLVKRAMNRAPAPTDAWWPSHARRCRGTFVKIAGPRPKKTKSKKAAKLGAVGVGKAGVKNLNDGVIRTLRIDHLMSRANKTKHSGSESTSCPMCDLQVDKKLLNKHLESCLPPEILSTQDNGLSLPKNRSNRSLPERKEPFGNETDTASTKKRFVAEIFEAPESRRREAIHQNHTHNITMSPNPKRRRSSTSLLMEDIIDVDALTAIAINPSGKTFVDVDKAVPPGPITARESKTRNAVPDIRVMLKPLLQPEEPIDIERKAISKLKAYFNDHGSRNPFSFYEAAKLLKMEQEKLLDSVRKGSTFTKDGDLRITREAKELIYPSQSLVCQGQEQLDDKQGWKSITLTAPSETVIHSKPVSRLEARVCPLCEESFSKVLFDGHLNQCLEKSNISSVLMDKDAEEEKMVIQGEDRGRSRHHGSKQVSLSRERGGAPQVNQDMQEIVNCPICDIGVHRSQMESHVASCLQCTGLLDAL